MPAQLAWPHPAQTKCSTKDSTILSLLPKYNTHREHRKTSAWRILCDDVRDPAWGSGGLTSSCACALAPTDRRYCTTAVCPASAASCSAVCPSFFTACKVSAHHNSVYSRSLAYSDTQYVIPALRCWKARSNHYQTLLLPSFQGVHMLRHGAHPVVGSSGNE